MLDKRRLGDARSDGRHDLEGRRKPAPVGSQRHDEDHDDRMSVNVT